MMMDKSRGNDVRLEVTVIAVGVVMLVIALVAVVVGASSETGSNPRAEREGLAAAWTDRHAIPAIITCRRWTSTCDVVPTDFRNPFQIACYESDSEPGCHLKGE